MIKIGITGGIGSGKSTLCRYLIEQKYKVFESDKEVTKLYDNQEFVQMIVKNFPEIFEYNQFNKNILADYVFEKQQALAKLEQIIHPIINKKIKEFFEHYKNEDFLFIEAPLLFEKRIDHILDFVILILAKQDIRKNRVLARKNMNQKKFYNILKTQMSDELKIKKTSFIILNNSTQKNLFNKFEEIKKEILVK